MKNGDKKVNTEFPIGSIHSQLHLQECLQITITKTKGGKMTVAKFEKVYPNNAGIDIGSEKIFIGIEGKEVVSYNTYTDSYTKVIEYLKGNKITTVAMEATGVYWMALYDMIEASGIKVSLVNPREVRNVPGRKSDVADCQWIQQLHSFGLLRECFIPEDEIRELRQYVRLRNDYIGLAAQHTQHMQKALDLMNIKLHNVISQITGASGMRILKAIIEGERNPEIMLSLCEAIIQKNKREEVIMSLNGNYRSEYIFLLEQAIICYEFFQERIIQCDKKIQCQLEKMIKDKPKPKNITRAKPIRHNAPQVDGLHEKIMQLTGGIDPSQITGFTDKTIMELVSEIGLDVSKWKTEKQFTSWLGLSPSKHQSGKSNKKRKRNIHTKAGQIFRQAALSIANSKHSALSGFYRRIKAKKGWLIAIKATARKLAVLYYNIMSKGTEYVEHGLIAYQQIFKEQQMKRLTKQAQHLGLQLVPIIA